MHTTWWTFLLKCSNHVHMQLSAQTQKSSCKQKSAYCVNDKNDITRELEQNTDNGNILSA